MTTRTIVTSQPDVACDVCERRLLRGEHAEVFLADGRPRMVCELCAPRAAHEGWLREGEGNSLALPPARPRRGRSFFERLRQVRRPADAASARPAPAARRDPAPENDGSYEDAPYDFLGHAEPVPAVAHPSEPEGELLQEPSATGADAYLVQAVEVFNASEYPRRVAGVARSLGAPEVNVRSAEHLASVVSIVIAWELCWYRYEVDLSEELLDARALAQGTELHELDREERVVNAVATESGALALTGARHELAGT